MSLKDLFCKTLGKYTKDAQFISNSYEYLEKKYTQASRYYHNLSHIQFMLSMLNKGKMVPENKDALILSIFYHDVIYKAIKKDNEYQSALVLEQHLSHTSIEHIKICKNQIIATKEHKISDSPDTNLLLDLDLSILGQEEITYKEYSKNVRKEYSIYPDFIYNPARKKSNAKIYEPRVHFQNRFFLF